MSNFDEVIEYIDVSVELQQLRLLRNNEVIFSAPVSTAKNGVGSLKNSGCTPLGWHMIRACIGDGATQNAVFVGRRPTGEIYSEELNQQYPNRDWILTRILWLSGLEVGKNRLANVDTMQRYIYIHGCPEKFPMGIPLSHGCIRMHNAALIELFDLVSPGFKVYIHH
jgi:lipoprotein-anchoring transpeptidase ErfK/SrfK